jgi:putative methylase
MKQKELEMALQKIPPHPSPRPELEQYLTPAHVAADILYTALAQGDIEEKKLVDLGCGTGMFAIGAKLLGAREVIGIDCDEESVEIAHRLSREKGLDIDFIVLDIEDFNERTDTVIMNPPFGCQKKGADLPFLKKALSLAEVTYSLHLSETVKFIRRQAKELKGVITLEKPYSYEIKHMFRFHTKETMVFEATLFRIVSKRK